MKNRLMGFLFGRCTGNDSRSCYPDGLITKDTTWYKSTHVVGLGRPNFRRRHHFVSTLILFQPFDNTQNSLSTI